MCRPWGVLIPPLFQCRYSHAFLLQNFQVQLSPFISQVEKPGKVDFKWIDGAHSAQPPPGFDTYFGNPPLYRHIDFDGLESLETMMDKIRELPAGVTAEDTMRQLVGEDGELFTAPAVKKAMDRLLKIMDEDPEIDVSGLFFNVPAPWPFPLSICGHGVLLADGYTAGNHGLLRGCNDCCNPTFGRTPPI